MLYSLFPAFYSLLAIRYSPLISKRLRHLAQPWRAVRIKSPRARRLFDHAIGGNEHGDRVDRRIIITEPGQRAARSSAEVDGNPAVVELACQAVHRSGRLVDEAHHDDRRLG